MEFQIILKSFIIGLAVSIPLGPIGVIIIQRTLNKGMLSGIFSGLGAVCVDLIFALIAVFGLTIIINFINENQLYIQIIASIILIVIGLHIYLSTTAFKLKAKQNRSKSYSKDFWHVFVLTFSNPLTLAVFLGAFAGTSVLGNNPTMGRIGLVILGIFFGGMCWWVILSGLVSLFRKNFRFRQMYWMNKITGIVITIIGVLALIASFIPNMI